MLKRKVRLKDNLSKDLLAALETTEGLPFARRQLLTVMESKKKVDDAIKQLLKKGLIEDYPPLVEKQGVRVAQTEHTIFIGENGAEVVTLLPS